MSTQVRRRGDCRDHLSLRCVCVLVFPGHVLLQVKSGIDNLFSTALGVVFVYKCILRPMMRCYRKRVLKPKDPEAANPAETTNIPSSLETKEKESKAPATLADTTTIPAPPEYKE